MNEALSRLGVTQAAFDLCAAAERELAPRFAEADAVAERNQYKVLAAMQAHRLSDAHFSSATGYGYNDAGRDALERIYADVFGADAALVRAQLISGTHALFVALSACLNQGDELLSAVGAPYDTLLGVIGVRPERGSLMERGVVYRQAELKDGKPDLAAIRAAITPKTRLALIQRSKGYAWRSSLSLDETAAIIALVKSINANIICLVDNCYCEFVDTHEPPEIGADLTVGSLIKNPGGGLAPVGGYILGKEELVEMAACRLTAPGLGREVGPGLGLTRPMAQGLFFAPTVTAAAHKGAMLMSAVFDKLGYPVLPLPAEPRADIVQAVRLGSSERVTAFCEAIQAAAPVDSFARPEPWAMPGYDCPVIMAAGAFTQGASIELSADAPIRPPYDVYFQGGLTYPHAKLGVMKAVMS